MIVFLAVIVGSIVIAMFLPLIDLMGSIGDDNNKADLEGDWAGADGRGVARPADLWGELN